EDLGDGDPKMAAKLLPLVYEELRALAQARMSHEPRGHSLSATALVHEAYLRLIGDGDVSWQSRGHFFAAAAESMRRILVERARRHRAKKHGGGWHRVSLDALDPAAPSRMGESDERLLALDEALAKFERQDRVCSDLVKLRFVAGLPIDQAADRLGISRATAVRYWTYARAWLSHEILKGPPADEGPEHAAPS
ncbi:MAG: ECF-type sigma factor, partial [Planctomycetota bacterium]